jgi:hypothetical protein
MGSILGGKHGGGCWHFKQLLSTMWGLCWLNIALQFRGFARTPTSAYEAAFSSCPTASFNPTTLSKALRVEGLGLPSSGNLDDEKIAARMAAILEIQAAFDKNYQRRSKLVFFSPDQFLDCVQIVNADQRLSVREQLNTNPRAGLTTKHGGHGPNIPRPISSGQ